MAKHTCATGSHNCSCFSWLETTTAGMKCYPWLSFLTLLSFSWWQLKANIYPRKLDWQWMQALLQLHVNELRIGVLVR